MFRNCKMNKILVFSDKYSYYIYLIHGTFVLSKYNTLFFSSSYALNIIISLLLVVVFALLLQRASSMILRFLN